jgi:hypothetical protein
VNSEFFSPLVSDCDLNPKSLLTLIRFEGIYAIPIFNEPLLVEIFEEDTNPLEIVVVIPYFPFFGWE